MRWMQWNYVPVVMCAGLFTGITPAFAEFPNGVSSGDVTADSAVLWTRTTVPGEVKFTLRRAVQNVDAVQQFVVTVTDPNAPAKVVFNGLAADTIYAYDVQDASGDYCIGTFKTPAAPGSGTGLRFGVSGDWRGELSPYPAISNARQLGLNFFVKLGDTMYGDFPSPAVDKPQAETLSEFRLKHSEVYSSRYGLNTWAGLQAVTPIYAMIDDHEVTNDFAGGAPAGSDPRFIETAGLINETQLYRNGLQAFTEYNAIQPYIYPVAGDPRTDGRPDLYRMQRFGDVAAMFMLDARSFRDKELAPVNNPYNFIHAATFLNNSFDPTRTMLSQRQRDRLLGDLLSAHNSGVTWKFVLVPEPMQNIGLIGASDRFEGYAAERTAILKFIDDNKISNVVFISADIHGTLVNNLTYQLSPLHPQILTRSFEITTGSVAFDAPLGPTMLSEAKAVPIAAGINLLDILLHQLGIANMDQFSALSNDAKNLALDLLINQQLAPLGYDPLGLEPGSPINATLTYGTYTNAFVFGWTEFDIGDDKALRVTTYGIEPYTRAELEADPASVIQRQPSIVSQFIVTPQ